MEGLVAQATPQDCRLANTIISSALLACFPLEGELGG